MPLKHLLQSALIASSTYSYSVQSFSLNQTTILSNHHNTLPSFLVRTSRSISSSSSISNSLSSNTKLNMSNNNNNNNDHHPELLVYDMDACLWDKEMYEMTAMPSTTVMGDLNGRGEGVIGVMSGRQKISLHKGSLISLQVCCVCTCVHVYLCVCIIRCIRFLWSKALMKLWKKIQRKSHNKKFIYLDLWKDREYDIWFVPCDVGLNVYILSTLVHYDNILVVHSNS